MAGQGRTLMVYLAADATKFKRGLTEAETQARGFTGAMQRTSASITGMLGPALAGAGIAAGYAAVQFGVDGVKAFMDDEAAASRLAQTLGNLGLQDATAQVETMIASTERLTGVADDQLRPSFDRLVRATGSVETATSAMKLAMDIAQGTGKDLEIVSNALGKAYEGNTGALGKLGTGLDKATLKSGDMKVITEQLASVFGGQATEHAKTLSGQFEILNTGIDNLKESFGRGFITTLSGGGKSLDGVNTSVANLQPTLERVGGSLGLFALGIGKITDAYNVLADIKPGGLPIFGSLNDILQAGIALMDEYKARQANLLDPNAQYQAAGGKEGGGGGSFTNPNSTGAPLQSPDGQLPSNQPLKAPHSDANYWAKFYDSLKPKVDQYNNSAGVTAKVTQTVKEALDAASTSIDAAYAPAITAVNAKIDGLTAAHDNLSRGIKDAITSTVSLSQAWAAASAEAKPGESVAAGTLTAFQKQIGDATSFATAIGALAGSPGVSEALITQLKEVAASQGPIAGLALANEIISSGMAPELSKQLQDLDVFAGETGQTVSGRFYNQGLTSAVELLNGLSNEVATHKKDLEKLGKNIGEPISKQIALEIAKAIDEGTKAGHAAAIEARAMAEAAAFSQQSTSRITPTSAGQGLTAVVAASDQRTGATPPALLV